MTLTSTDYKARSINLKALHYGTFAEIGAGQEVARYFFQAGHASATVAKTMSAYDKHVSDDIYGKTGRFVSRDRLSKMLNHEYELLEKRLHKQGQKKSFFAFANTVTTSGSGHCWCGLRFQLQPGQKPCEVVLHIHMHDSTRLEQHEALGILGVNLIYACFEGRLDESSFVQTLQENLRPGRVDIDSILSRGEALKPLENIGLELVAQKLSRALLFEPAASDAKSATKAALASGSTSVSGAASAEGGASYPRVCAAGEALYDKNILVQRGTFRPITNTHVQVLQKGEKHLQQLVGAGGVSVLEISVHKYLSQAGKLDRPDLWRRIRSLTSLGYYVLVSNYARLSELRRYLRSFTKQTIAFVMGADKLEPIFASLHSAPNDNWLDSTVVPFAQGLTHRRPKDAPAHLEGDLLVWLLALFDAGTKILVFPYKTEQVCVTARVFSPPKPLSYLYQYFLSSGHIVDIAGCDDVDLSIRSQDVRAMMQAGDIKWKALVPSKIITYYE